MKKVAIVSGGYTDEKIISLQTANTFLSHISTEKYEAYIVVIDKEGWFADTSQGMIAVDKNDFSFWQNNEHITFDVALIALHGPPGENGWLQGYFEMLEIPYTTGNQLNMAVTFHKKTTTDILLSKGFFVAKSVLFSEIPQGVQLIRDYELTYPMFIKPVQSGSSLGISKVRGENELENAIGKALLEDAEVMAEEMVVGNELTCGVLQMRGKTIALPVTEIRSKNDFFDYKAKYHKESDEITPAEISKEDTSTIQNTSIAIYKALSCRGVVRVDFILSNGKPYVIELNTVPGMSEESIIPQQIKAGGMHLTDVLTAILEDTIQS